MEVLLVDDCLDTGFQVKKCLFPLAVTQAVTISDARTFLKERKFDLLLIDITLPDGNGFLFCAEISKNLDFSTTPIVLLTGKDDVTDKVYGFSCGACDYITKPFSSAELNARILSHLRKKIQLTDSQLKSKDFELDTNLQKCFIIKKEGQKETRKDCELTPTEFRILLNLFKSKGSTLSRQQLIRAVWRNNGLSIEQKGLDTHIAHLRKKLSKFGSQIVSVYGVGYLYNEAST